MADDTLDTSGPITWMDAVKRLTARLDELDAAMSSELGRIETMARHALGERMHSHVDDAFYPPLRAGVLIIRSPDGTINAQHIMVRHIPLLDAPTAIHYLRTGGVAFVQATVAGYVLDALGVPRDESA
ncbi:MAG: hypothetical protein IPM06_20780 [Rhizobiales bacterium]|nr:hypothetical protein [Hyphomicrobiales bacterium]